MTNCAAIHCRSKGSQSGMTLIEVLAALVILGLGVTGLAFATLGTIRGANTARTKSELNALLTSYGEALKAVPYRICASTSDYEDLFLQAETLSPEAVRLQGQLNATLSVVDVTDNTPSVRVCPGGDSGTQLLSLQAAARGQQQQIQIVKRTPRPEDPPASIDFHALRRTGVNSPTVEFGVLPDVVSTSGVALYEWWCHDPDDPEDDWMEAVTDSDGGFITGVVLPPPDYLSVTRNDPVPKCAPGNPGEPGYKALQAPINTTGNTWIALRVTEMSSVSYPPFVKPVELPTTTVGAQPPYAVINWLTSPVCTSALVALGGDKCNTTEDIQLNGEGSFAGDGRRLLTCTWTFSDGTAPTVHQGTSCFNEIVTHRFGEEGPAFITLRVTDDVGQVATDTINIQIEGPPRPKPIVQIAASVDGGSTWAAPGTNIHGVEDLKVAFRSNGTQAQGGAIITGYSWSFGEGSVGAGASPEFLYMNPSTGSSCNEVPNSYTVTLRVNTQHPTDGWVASNTASICVTVRPLVSPTFLAHASASEYIYFSSSWPFIHVGVEFTYRWIPIEPTPSDQSYRVEIRVSSPMGLSCTLPETTYVIDRNIEQLPNSSFWQGSYRVPGLGVILSNGWSSFWGSFAQSCQFQGRVIRTDFQGNQHYSPWSPAQSFRTYW